MKSKERKHSIFKLLMAMVVGALLGGLVGFFGKFLTAAGQVENSLRGFFLAHSSQVLYIVMALFAGLSLIFYFWGKREFLDSLSKDRDILEEDKLSIALVLSSLGILISFLAFGLYAQYLNISQDFSLAIINALLFIIAIIFYAIFQNSIIQLIKSAYPEKQGDPFDFSFHKSWMASMDEREKMEAYFAGFMAFKSINAAIFLILIIICILAINMEIQLLTFGLLFALIVISNLTYLYYSIKGKEKLK